MYFILDLEHRPVADIVVSRKDFDNALLNFIPSTSSEELRRYEEIQRRLQRN